MVSPAPAFDVSLVHLMDRLMERQLDPRAAGLLKSEVEAKGIRVVLEAETAAIEGMTAVEAVRLKDGRRLAAHMVVVAIGIRPETGIARGAGLACNRGVVDDGLETSAPGIYAIGECAEHRGQCYGLVEPGYAQARILATRLGGGRDLHRLGAGDQPQGFRGRRVLGGRLPRPAGHRGRRLSDPGLPAYKKLVIQDASGQRLVGAVLLLAIPPMGCGTRS